ncbi:hypothetical protein PLIIFM63780_010592 [Purpureocillium lilacinum]|nr:hypothetical protein PLIIFM63780_010592 [Purpureocillium lilacinum]
MALTPPAWNQSRAPAPAALAAPAATSGAVSMPDLHSATEDGAPVERILGVWGRRILVLWEGGGTSVVWQRDIDSVMLQTFKGGRLRKRRRRLGPGIDVVGWKGGGRRDGKGDKSGKRMIRILWPGRQQDAHGDREYRWVAEKFIAPERLRHIPAGKKSGRLDSRSRKLKPTLAKI